MQKKRLNFTLPEDAYDDLKKLSNENGLTVSEIMREAIRIYKWAKMESGKGHVIISKSNNDKGAETRVIL